MQRILDTVERVGNRVPHPVMIFVYLIIFVVLLSALLSLLGAQVTYQAYNPATGKFEEATTAARSLLTKDGIRFMFTGVVPNFMGFNAVGVIIVAMVGVGVAEEAGLVKALIRKLVIVAPPKMLTYILVFVGIVSSIAADAGYLVLIPLAAAAFLSVGRHPLAGLAMAFADFRLQLVQRFLHPGSGLLPHFRVDARLLDPGRRLGRNTARRAQFVRPHRNRRQGRRRVARGRDRHGQRALERVPDRQQLAADGPEVLVHIVALRARAARTGGADPAAPATKKKSGSASPPRGTDAPATDEDRNAPGGSEENG
jgi:hypothetical protein